MQTNEELKVNYKSLTNKKFQALEEKDTNKGGQGQIVSKHAFFQLGNHKKTKNKFSKWWQWHKV
jgi:hypothetical protein